MREQRGERAAREDRAEGDLAVAVVVELAERVSGEVKVREPADDVGAVDDLVEVVDAVVREVELLDCARRLCARVQHAVRRAIVELEVVELERAQALEAREVLAEVLYVEHVVRVLAVAEVEAGGAEAQALEALEVRAGGVVELCGDCLHIT